MDDAVAKALHAVRHHLAGGGFLSDLFSGPDYLSTGEAASPTNWGDPESAADFFKADRALRLAREVQAKADDVTGSVPAREPLTAPRPGAVEERALPTPPVNIPFTAPERGAAMLGSDVYPESVVSLPIAYSPEPAKLPAQAAIDEATKLTARAPQGPDLNDRQRDLIIRTIAAETSGKTPEESQAIAHVILNRIASGKYGASPEAVLFARKQFEPWSNPNGSNYPMRFTPESRRYGLGQTALDAALGAEDITKGATNFWAPKAQAALGRRPPKWGRTGGVDIGETRFHNLSRADGGEVDDALHVVRERHADGEAVGQAPEAPTPEDAAVTIARRQPLTPASLARAWTTPEEAIEVGVGPRARTLMETYPVAVSKGIAAMPSAVAHSIQDPFELAHQAATNQLPPDYFHSDEGISRALNAAGLAQTGGLGGVSARAGETVLGAGPVRKVGMGHNMPPPEDAMMLVHNLKSHRLADIEKLGGLPVPSTAIIKPSQGFTNFGDITMVAPKEMAQPSRMNPTFAADVYTPRFPSVDEDLGMIFKGYTPSGKRRYVPLTLENVVKEMKGNIRGGEGFNYGVGTIRSGVAPQFKSIEQIQNARDLIQPRESLQPMFDVADKKFVELSDKYYPHYKYSGNEWQHQNDLADMLREAGMGKWYELFNAHKSTTPPELRQEAVDFLNYLKKMPTEYFEGKPQRAVRLNEFRGAVVPGDIAGEQADILRRMGVERLEQYDPNNPASRIEALQKFGGEQFAEGGSVEDRALMLISKQA